MSALKLWSHFINKIQSKSTCDPTNTELNFTWCPILATELNSTHDSNNVVRYQH